MTDKNFLDVFATNFKVHDESINAYLAKQAEIMIKGRAQTENFDIHDGDFGTLSPEQAFVQLLFTGFVKDQFYQTADKIFETSLRLHAYYCEKYPETYVKLIRFAREKTGIKDQLLIGAFVANDASLLETLPPQQVLKYFTWHKKFGFPVGSRAKKLVAAYLIQRHMNKDTTVSDKFVEDITIHREVIRKLIRLTHMNMIPEFYQLLTSLDSSLEKTPISVKSAFDVITYKSIASVSEDNPIPFEVMRSNVKKENWVFSKVTMSPYMALSMAKAIAESGGEYVAVNFLRNGKYLTSDKLFTALVNIPAIYPKVKETIGNLYVERVKDQYKELLLFDEAKDIIAVLDISGSMDDNFTKMLGMIAPFAPLISKLYMFSDNVFEYPPVDLLTPQGIEAALHKMHEESAGTNLMEALTTLEKYRTPKIIVLVTDEQGNYMGDQSYGIVISKLVKRGHKIIIVNPSSYSAHSVGHREGVIYLPAINAETFAGAMRLLELEEHKYAFELE